jgi:hypothetical protein
MQRVGRERKLEDRLHGGWEREARSQAERFAGGAQATATRRISFSRGVSHPGQCGPVKTAGAILGRKPL